MSDNKGKKKLKVCHMTSAHGQEDTRIFHKECISLANAGYEVYLISCGKTYEKKGVHIIGVSEEKVSRVKRMLIATNKIYRKALEIDADIFHAHDPELLPICAKLKKKGKIVIFDSHEYVVGTIKEKKYIPKPMRELVSNIYSYYQKSICSKIDAVVTATPNISTYFRRIGCECVVALCNFPILSELKKADYKSRNIVFAGSMDEQWNHEKIIAALEGIENVKYIFCSPPEEDKLEKLRRLSGWGRVDYRGKIPFEKVPDILAEAKVGLSILSPGNNTDGMNGNMANTKIFEEMMAGLPIICTKFRRWKKLTDKYHCGICVNPQSVKEIRNAIRQLVDDENIAEIMGMNGRKAVEKKFNWGCQERKLLQLYKNLEKGIV